MGRVYPLIRSLPPQHGARGKVMARTGVLRWGPGEAVHNGVADCEATRNESAWA